MKTRLTGLVMTLALLLASAQAQEPNEQVTVAMIDDLVCFTMLLPGELPWYQALALFSDSIDQLMGTLEETGEGYVPMDRYHELKDAGIEASTGDAYAWAHRITTLTPEEIAELGPDPWAPYALTDRVALGALLPPKGTTAHPAVEMTLCTQRPPF